MPQKVGTQDVASMMIFEGDPGTGKTCRSHIATSWFMRIGELNPQIGSIQVREL